MFSTRVSRSQTKVEGDVFNVANGQTKADLQNAINEMSDLLDTAYASESSQRLGG